MSQEQPRRPESGRDPINYGDVFDIHGELASKPIASHDASVAQSVESQVLGQPPRGSPAAVMESAARLNLRAVAVDRNDITEAVAEQGVTSTESTVGGAPVVTERVGEEIVGQYVDPSVSTLSPGAGLDITIGDALEATALSAGDKPIDQSDAAAIQAAEVKAIGSNETVPGGIAAQAQSAAEFNLRMTRDEDKTTLSDVLADATLRLASDRKATSEDARGVIAAEMRNKPDISTTPGGVAASVWQQQLGLMKTASSMMKVACSAQTLTPPCI